MKISLLNTEKYTEYDNFLKRFDETLLYSSSKFKTFLEKQTGAKPYYLLVEDKNEIIGSLPLFLKESKYGNVLNSLPFYGSNGGIVSSDSAGKKLLYDAFNDLVKQQNCLAATFITSPFEKDLESNKNNLNYQLSDERIGQITHLTNTKEELMGIFHAKTRNHIAKGSKNNLEITWEDGMNYMDFLFQTHRENISAIGGLWKPESFFDNIATTFIYGSEMRIYIAKYEGKPIAAMMVIYFNKTVEYFCPATVAEFRNMQPMSSLIYRGMSDAIPLGYKYWNWGGTWLSQGGVYDFKSRWGTTDYPYYYFTSIPDLAKVKAMTKKFLLNEYPYFYVIPFQHLES